MGRGLVALLALALGVGGCGGSDEPTLYVDVRSDFVPGADFSRVETLLADEPIGEATETRRIERTDLEGTDFATGVRVAVFETVPQGTRYLEVRLYSAGGAIVVARRAVVEVRGDTAVTLIMSRSCGGIDCPAEMTCQAGACVDPRCTVETPEACGEPECGGATSCPPAAGCLEPQCAAGVCLVATSDARCAAGERCAPFGECVAAPMDAGVPPAGDGGTPPRDGGDRDASSDGGRLSSTYCPDAPVLRQQLAVYLVKYLRGTTFVPPPATGYFTDVDPMSSFAPWVEQLRNDGITAGCGDHQFCPDDPVRREAGAVLLVRTRYGAAYTPPPATGTVFTDVPASSVYAPFIEQLARDGVTAGCSPGLYCPTVDLTRGQVAVFIIKMRYGPTYTPPPAVGLFSDVDPGRLDAPSIEKFALDGFAAGCL